jgi:hypothetical protein
MYGGLPPSFFMKDTKFIFHKIYISYRSSRARYKQVNENHQAQDMEEGLGGFGKAEKINNYTIP